MAPQRKDARRAGAIDVQRAAVAAKLLKAREKLDISQAEMAERCGVSQATISDWENGKYLPDPLRMRDVAAEYKLDVVDLIPKAA